MRRSAGPSRNPAFVIQTVDIYLYCWLYALCISSPVVVSTRDLREALKAAILWSLPLRGRVVEDASKLLSLGFHTGDPITNQRHHFLQG
ncbi:hypothetical protein Zmor_013032 [Zophobas morio]|uniref:Uncharacterized protein n=1 Tax=Zophobas morio TaxID=2755281 RepID=A0AA38MF74_9CUCU|nr:hypothetical protein Zmor_013032 [Zophobas morio]